MTRHAESLPGLEAPRVHPDDLLAEAIERYEPALILGMFSGGNDSGATVHWLYGKGLMNAALHINTGIGIRQTREFVRWYCRDYMGVKLIERSPRKARNYRWLVGKFGFPGPGFHKLAYIYLKQRVLDSVTSELLRDYPRGSKLLLVSGAHREESERRMGYAEPISCDEKNRPRQVWVNPFFDFTKPEMRAYREVNGIPENEVSALLHKSGECLCGAFASPGELAMTRSLYPEVAQEIDYCTAIAQEQGTWDQWGVKPPKRFRPPAGQDELPMFMCAGCPPEPVEGAKC